MAHAAEINADNIVVRVLVVPDEQENNIQEYLGSRLGGTWIQTSYNGNIRKNYAGVGYSYDPQRDAFIPPKPYPSWVLNEQTCRWDAPVARPNDGGLYQWDEGCQAWLDL